MMQKKWVLSQEANEKNIIETLLKNRGITEVNEIDEFLSDKPKLTYDPFLLKNMDEASNRIIKAVENKEKICIYGDYDADGVCGVSLLLEILGKVTDKITYYIPSRFNEGYGLNKDAISRIGEDGANLVITVDCGSGSNDEVEHARKLGIDVIVTDHHNIVGEQLPCLFINPKQKDCPYPEKNLSGCGVAFKLAQALQRKIPKQITRADLGKVLDLVAIATIGDIVPLSGENRTMVKYGLRTVNNQTRPGLSLLINSIGLEDREIKSVQIAYVIVPHLNAAGRMVSADTGVKLLTSDSEKEREEASRELIRTNKERKRLQELFFDMAVQKVEEKYLDEKIIVLNLDDAHEGVTGIVAGKLKDRFSRPAIILTPTGNNMLKGTGRSVDGLDLYAILSHCSHLFDKFGGHEGACGFTMGFEKLDILRETLRSLAETVYEKNPTVFQPKLVIDAQLSPLVLNKELISSLERLEPFGHKNPKPVFAFTRASISEPYYMGDQQQHVRFEADGVKCVFFNDSPRFREFFELGKRVDLAGYPEINYWNGYEKIQFIVEDLK
ncbi:MAG TPA: single-stranded-DNA-specific exonuclease RecJ [Anaerovoracaceae bacterium]|nr:single-stranded-DNA-specific exonuclease RecJ [Anaerovoracaceae bacterium]